MIKKKVLVHGSVKSLSEFVSSPFSTEFEPLALVTDEFLNLSMTIRQHGGGGGHLKSLRLKIFRALH